MSKVTLTPVQRKAFIEVIATANSTAAESTVKALLRRNLIAPEGDGFAVTKAGRMFIALDDKTDLTSAMVEGRKVAGRKDLPPVKGNDLATEIAQTVPEAAAPAKKPSGASKKAAKMEEDRAKREAKADPAAGMNAALAGTGIRVEFEPNVPGEVETDAPVVEPKAAPKTERLTMVKEPKAPATPKVDKDSTIRVAKQIRTFIDGHAVKTDPLAKRIATADLAKDESVRISINDAELDVLRGWAVAMSDGSTTGRGDVRSARALVQWIDGMKARRAAKK